MEKKILKRGYCTSLISLPREWIKKNDFTFGEKINLIVSGKDIIIKGKKQQKEIILDLAKYNPWKTHYFCQLYQRGYDKIIFLNPSKEKIEMIKNNLWNFPGTKLEKETKKRAQFSISDLQENYPLFLKEAFNESFYHIKILKERGDSKKSKITLQKIYSLAELVTRKINKDVPEMEQNYRLEVPSALCFINQMFYFCMKYIHENNVALSKKSKELINSIKGCLQIYYDNLYKGKPINLKKYLKFRKKLKEFPEEPDFFDDININEFYIIEKLIHAGRLTAKFSSRRVELLYGE